MTRPLVTADEVLERVARATTTPAEGDEDSGTRDWQKWDLEHEGVGFTEHKGAVNGPSSYTRGPVRVHTNPYTRVDWESHCESDKCKDEHPDADHKVLRRWSSRIRNTRGEAMHDAIAHLRERHPEVLAEGQRAEGEGPDEGERADEVESLFPDEDEVGDPMGDLDEARRMLDRIAGPSSGVRSEDA